MVKYYWYVDADTDRISKSGRGLYGLSNESVKRTPTPPVGNYEYLIETIDGTKHSVKNKENKPIFTMNDNGDIDDITKINKMITSKIVDITSDIINKKQESISKAIELAERSPFYQRSLYSSPELSMVEVLRRKKRIKSRLNRTSSKKKVTKKRSK
jgi:hypothetical protein